MLLPDCPVELNFISSYLQRATELAPVQPVMSYYCLYYSVSLALKNTGMKFQRNAQTDTFLSALFDNLEDKKKALADHDTVKELEQGAIYVREFAYRVFISGEKNESANDINSDKKAVQNYLAAINFLQVYRGVFLEDSDVLEEETRKLELAQVDEKSKYAKWRVIELKKKINLGNYINSTSTSTQPENINTNTTTTVVDSHKSPVSSVSTHSPSPVLPTLPTIKPEPVVCSSYPSSTHSSPTLMYDPKTISECEKLARFGISALHFDDIPTAIQNFQDVLKILATLQKH